MDKLPQKLVEFLKENHELPYRYHKRTLECAMHRRRTLFDKVRVVGLGCLNASRQRIDAKEELTKSLEFIRGYQKISFFEFVEEFPQGIRNKQCELDLNKSGNENEKKIKEFFNKLVSLRGFKEKTASLFMRDLLEMSGSELFIDFEYSRYRPHMLVPLDKVIKQVLENIGFEKNEYSNFKLVNKLAKETFLDARNPLLLEDLWFWGFYTRSLDKKNKFDFNGPKMYADKYLLAEEFEEVETKAKEFVGILDENKKRLKANLNGSHWKARL